MKVCALNYLEEQTFVLSASNLLVSFKHKTLIENAELGGPDEL